MSHHQTMRRFGLVAAVCALLLGCRSWRYEPLPTVPTYTVPPPPLSAAVSPPGPAVVPAPVVPGTPVAPVAPVVPVPAMQAVAAGRLSITPAELVAPVCTEVILVASVCDGGYLRANQRVNWTLSPESVGQIVNAGEAGAFSWLISPFTAPRHVSPRQASAVTAEVDVNLPGGPCIRRGQSWVALTSVQEGVSCITAVTPDLPIGSANMQAATVYWVDGQWTFPPPSMQPLGAVQRLTTTVARSTNGSPVAGWLVRYEIVSGPEAGFGPQRSRVVEVPTDELGQATVELMQNSPSPGMNEIRIDVIYPQGGKRLVVGRGSVQHTWTSSLALTISGPAQAQVGATVEYVMEVNNPSNQAASNVAVALPIPDGYRLVRTDPPAEQVGSQVQWQFPLVAAGDRRSLAARFQVERPGQYDICATLVASGDAQFQQCTSTTVPGVQPPNTRPAPQPQPQPQPQPGPQPQPIGQQLDVQLTGPTQVNLGQEVTFTAVITNRGSRPATNVLIWAAFDAGLQHAAAPSPIERPLDDLSPGQSRTIDLTFRTVQAGRQCTRVEITADGANRATANACVNVSPAGGGNPRAELRKTGPAMKEVGQDAEFAIEVRNTGDVELNNLVITDRYGPELRPVFATENHRLREGNGYTLTWNVDRLPVGESVQLRVVCRCESAAVRTCSMAEVTADRRINVSDQACLAIRAPESMLQVSVVDLYDPAEVGQDVPFEIRITNRGATSATHVTVDVFLPPELSPRRVGTGGETRNFEINGQTVQFPPFPELQPGQSITYRVRARAERPGNKVTVEARVGSDQLSQPITSTTTTDIFQKM